MTPTQKLRVELAELTAACRELLNCIAPIKAQPLTADQALALGMAIGRVMKFTERVDASDSSE